MDMHLSPALELRQTLKLSQVMIQRFNVLEQSPQEFESDVAETSKKNPFIKVRFFTQQSAGFVEEGTLTAVDYATYSESLMSVLTNQLDHQVMSEQSYNIVLSLIDCCDEQGFLKDFSTVCKSIITEFKVTEADVLEGLKVLHAFEPEGVGARSIKECLLIQIHNHDLDDQDDKENLIELVTNYLDQLEAKEYTAICDDLGFEQSDLDTYIEFLGHLNPSPGAAYSQSGPHHIQPSVRITVEDGVLSLTHLEEERMTFNLDETLLKKLEQLKAEDSDEAILLQAQLNEAKVWMEHVKKRQNLIKLCAEYLMQKQRLFFLEGEQYVVPSLQRDMAQALGVSQSTISRVVRSKYVECSHGMVLMQSLCQRNIYGKTPRQVKALVTYYCERYPNLSDIKVSELLRSIGLPIARRTVAKYRAESHINSSYHRKK
jgi:RNA polymerase sigma-54 factor